MKFDNIRIDDTIFYTLSQIFIKKDDEIIKKTIPQFKKDLFSLWNGLNDTTQKRILNILPEAWDDFHKSLQSQTPTEAQ